MSLAIIRSNTLLLRGARQGRANRPEIDGSALFTAMERTASGEDHVKLLEQPLGVNTTIKKHFGLYIDLTFSMLAYMMDSLLPSPALSEINNQICFKKARSGYMF